MKTVAICNPCMQDIACDSFFDEFLIDEHKLTISLLDAPESDFTSLFTSHSVVVKVQAFSCNYRDRSLMHQFAEQCKTLSGNQKYFYSPVGSEFVGQVVKIGSEVTSVCVGDRVMSDNSYPLKQDGSIGGVVTNFASQRLLLFLEHQLIKVPDKMPDEVAAAFSISAQTAYSMVRKANLKAGDNILITALTSNTSLAIVERLKSCNANINIYGMSSKALSLKKQIKEWGLKDIFLPPFSQNGQLTENNYIDKKFDVIFDPFIDLYFADLSNHINFDPKYIFCGFYQQHPSYKEMDVLSQNSLSTMYRLCITYNMSLIGNCLGNRKDLEKALSDFSDGKFSINIDSVYTGNQLVEFFQKSFLKEKNGKVVYKYEE